MTYEPSAIQTMLRQHAREKLAELEAVCRQLVPGLDLPERLELSCPIAELRRLLAGDIPPEATQAAPANVKPLRIAVGPFFRRRSLFPDDGPGAA